MPILIDTNRIRTDLGTQNRVETNEAIVKEYAEDMERGDTFPAISVIYDEDNDYFILVDGFHRLAAHKIVFTNDQIRAEMKFGKLEDALSESAAANKTNSFRRTNADKRKAVMTVLPLQKWTHQSNREIAKHVGVGEATVRNIRHELESTAQIAQSNTRIGADGRTINTSKIGKTIKTADGLEHEQHKATSFVRIGDNFDTVKNPPPGWANCNNCSFWFPITDDRSLGTCSCDGEEREGTYTGCPDWEIEIESERVVKQEPDPVLDLDTVTFYDKPKKRGSHVHTAQKIGDTTQLRLPNHNAEEFAAELLHHFSWKYLSSVWTAFIKIKSDKE
ncbi:MAG: hypothetical protein ACRC2T_05165 [Thermoguttaceae bacterium]